MDRVALINHQLLPGKDKPSFPLNLLADFAAGGLLCVIGVLLALLERGRSNVGQVVDIDMVAYSRSYTITANGHRADDRS